MSTPLLALLLAIAGLFVGPVLYGMPHWKAWDRVLDSFTVVAIGGLCLLHLLPEAIAHGGWPAVVFAAVGLVLPRLLQGLAGAGPWLLLGGLVLHAGLEAGALNTGHGHGALGMAIVLHRVPVGLAVFSMYHDHPTTNGRGWLAIVALVVATVAGFFGGGWAGLAGGGVEAALNAAVAGMLLHVVWGHTEADDGHGHAHPVARGGVVEALAAVLGLLVVVGMVVGDGHLEHSLARRAMEVTVGLAPLAVVGYGALALGLGLRDRTTAANRLATLVDASLPWFWVGVVAIAIAVPVGRTEGWTLLSAAPVAAVCAFTLVSVVRHGPRGMIGFLTEPRWTRG